jgi:hypothetical protein
MSPDEKEDCELSAQNAFTMFLKLWRVQLLIDEAEGDADQIELDRRVLDHYLDQYNLAVLSGKNRVNSIAEDSCGILSTPHRTTGE